MPFWELNKIHLPLIFYVDVGGLKHCSVPFPLIFFCDQQNAFSLVINLSVFAFYNNSYNFMVLCGHFSLFLIILNLTNWQPLVKLTEKLTSWNF